MPNDAGSIFDVPPDFFDSCRLLESPNSSLPDLSELPATSAIKTLGEEVAGEEQQTATTKAGSVTRWSCNTCKAEFESLQDQRSHFKSDFHGFNIKLTTKGKNSVNEEDFDVLNSASLFKEYDISSISGSEDEAEKGSFAHTDMHSVKQKLFIQLQRGEKVSIWKCLLLDDAESILFENDILGPANDGGFMPCLREKDVIEKLKFLIHEPRDNIRLRVVLLASGGHFAGCVFDGNLVVAHKTFHRC